MKRLVLATKNKGKVREIRELLQNLPLEIVGLEAYPDAPEVVETGVTFAENATLKAKIIAEFTGQMTLSDDSGLEVDVLNGAPGVYSARYGEPGWNDQERYQYLLEKMKDIPETQRTARFQAVIALYEPALGLLELAQGTIEGKIGTVPRGNNGFGYDPVFYLNDSKTMAELSEVEKNQQSHRSRALERLKPRLSELLRQG